MTPSKYVTEQRYCTDTGKPTNGHSTATRYYNQMG